MIKVLLNSFNGAKITINNHSSTIWASLFCSILSLFLVLQCMHNSLAFHKKGGMLKCIITTDISATHCGDAFTIFLQLKLQTILPENEAIGWL